MQVLTDNLSAIYFKASVIKTLYKLIWFSSKINDTDRCSFYYRSNNAVAIKRFYLINYIIKLNDETIYEFIFYNFIFNK